MNWKVAAADALLVTAACLIPAASHLVGWPLYKLDPMRWLLLAGVLLGTTRGNGYLVALLMPMAACLISGMPAPPAKAAIIAVELCANVAIYQLISKRMPAMPAMLLAIVGAKGVYYALKGWLLAPAVLIDTNVWLQLGMAVAMSLLFAWGARMKDRP